MATRFTRRDIEIDIEFNGSELGSKTRYIRTNTRRTASSTRGRDAPASASCVVYTTIHLARTVAAAVPLPSLNVDTAPYAFSLIQIHCSVMNAPALMAVVLLGARRRGGLVGHDCLTTADSGFPPAVRHRATRVQ